MSGPLAALIVVGLISSGIVVTYLWRRGADWWREGREWLKWVPLYLLGYWVGVLHGFLRAWLGAGLWLAGLVVLIALMARVAIRDEPHLWPPGARVDGHPSNP